MFIKKAVNNNHEVFEIYVRLLRTATDQFTDLRSQMNSRYETLRSLFLGFPDLCLLMCHLKDFQ